MRERKPLPIVGWREWVSLPDLGVDWIKAKLDTGARSSAIHAYGIESIRKRGQPWVRFMICPFQRNSKLMVESEALVLDRREIKSSSGVIQERIVIQTVASLIGQRCPIELTLAKRDAMGFRMLMGRQAVRGRFVVDPGRSYLGGRPPADVRRLGRKRKK